MGWSWIIVLGSEYGDSIMVDFWKSDILNTSFKCSNAFSIAIRALKLPWSPRASPEGDMLCTLLSEGFTQMPLSL